ncbi:hypothetical protein EAH79_16870 [Sphingomonas koreensis]|nr:hypothetical protein EAH79_16870 [Sphingomonas koreensis]
MGARHRELIAEWAPVFLFVLVIGALIVIARMPSQPKEMVTARIVRIDQATSIYVQVMDITLRTKNGLTGMSTIPTTTLTCHVGQDVRAVRNGVSLHLLPGQCTRSKLW